MPDKNVVLRKFDTLQRRLRKRYYQWRHPSDDTTPVFIVGNQRSGTSMALRVFDLCFDADVFNTGDNRAYDNGMLLGPDVIRGHLRRSRATALAFKPQHDMQRLPQLLREYPDVRVVWMVREPNDTINSAARMWPKFIATLKRMAEEPDNAGWHGELLTEHQRDVLGKHYHDDISLESAYALFWYVRNSFYYELGLDREPAVRLFCYERAVQTPRDEFPKMFEFVGCPYSPACTREIFASSVHKNSVPTIEPELRELVDGLYAKMAAEIAAVK